ncbi:MBL fold metallo-hydrolase [Mycobacterium intracellulare]|uniref:MBL fold metallo-hydrolase n=1 Tax=Mycobacterium intracellulare TaxID=1767 RepID=UPI001CDA8605|nr:MBL fold metallo-hydrolase [Mycobacterium intracellulare]MCA2256007.1 MBL fold metallo-hydrolase [Mycobacterium intracellulare]
MSHGVVEKRNNLCIERVVTRGTFKLDGGSWEVENNIWLLGDDSDVLIVDAAHHAEPIIDAVAGRNVVAVVCTHGHNDHITVAPELGKSLLAPVLLHPADAMLWEEVHGDAAYWPLHHGQRIGVAGTEIEVLHTPGHSPGSVCLYLGALDAVFSGDTLFSGGPGATGRSYSDFPTIVASISQRLGQLPDNTTVYTGHGNSTTLGDELDHHHEWSSG